MTPEVIRIAQSPPALSFKVVIAPNDFVKRIKNEDRRIDQAIAPLREAVWGRFGEARQADPVLSACQRRYGGRLGFQWLIPPYAAPDGGQPPHVLVYIATRTDGRRFIGFGVYPPNTGTETWDALCDHAWERAEARLRTLGELGSVSSRSEERVADFSSDEAIASTIAEIVPRVRIAYEELCRAIETSQAPASA